MIQTKKLLQFYIAQYEMQAKSKQRRPGRAQDLERRTVRFQKTLREAKPSQVSILVLEDYHKQIKNLLYFVLRSHRDDLRQMIYEEMLPKLVKLDLGMLLAEQRDGIDGEFLAFLKRRMPGKICSKPLFVLYPLYRKFQLETKILDLVPTRPELEFPEALEMQRHFILHIGPTNSGKTFHALERLRQADRGAYLGPLRLLALEVYERMREFGVPCTMLTGQECIEDPDSRIVASTVEMADYDEYYDVVVIDEAQLMSDAERGHSWTRAILGMKAAEIHVCASPTAEEVLKHLIELCGDTFEVHRYERKTRLVFDDKPFSFPEDVQKGDALITFSKKSVLDVAGRLEEIGKNASIIYGSLPPEVRRRQMRLFADRRTKVVVSTDAIGMGLNLPVRRIVFLQADKFDGISRRPLETAEIRQIAGRAGRYGLYDTGYITAMGEEALDYIRSKYQEEEQPVEEVILGFPQVLLDLDEPLDEILKVWQSVAPSAPFKKENVDEALFLYERAYRERNRIDGFENKRLLYRMITCPIDIKDRSVVGLWLDYCRTYSADVSLKKPRLDRRGWDGIQKYETYYRQLDLYYQFSQRMGKLIDEKWLKDEREKTEVNIMRSLAKGKTEYIARCPYCGKLLPLGYPYRACEACRARD